jgi:hypothetical protein
MVGDSGRALVGHRPRRLAGDGCTHHSNPHREGDRNRSNRRETTEAQLQWSLLRGFGLAMTVVA